jgi:hypothetical protein
MAEPLDPRVLGVLETVGRVEGRTYQRTEPDQVKRGEVRHIGKGRLWVDDGIKIPAIGNIDSQFTQAFHSGGQALRMHESRHIGQLNLFHIAAFLAVFGGHQPGRSIKSHQTRRPGRHQPLLNHHRHRANGAMAAHRQAAGRLDEQDRHVAVILVGG